MNALLNCSTLVKGGALQVALSFIEQMLNAGDEDDWCMALSAPVYEQAKDLLLNRRSRVEVIEPSPARSLLARKTLRRMEAEIQPDVVFTLFGPSYVRFRSPHICGVAVPWVTHPNLLAYSRLCAVQQVFSLLDSVYRGYWFRQADAWVVEAPVAKRGLMKLLRLSAERITVVPNNCGQHYLSANSSTRLPSPGDTVRILTFSAYYPHKDLQIIPSVARELAKLRPEVSFKFVLTIPHDSAETAAIMDLACAYGVSERIENIGPVPVRAGPDLYQSCHMSFLPSLLETFSANYPEAMAMHRPLVTTDLDFAKDVCGPAAVYFKPKDPVSAATAILSLIENPRLWMKLLEEGERVLSSLPTPERKYALYRDCVIRLVAENRKQRDVSC
jgi:glycosyltransferase involved in cell wall biosynthesis